VNAAKNSLQSLFSIHWCAKRAGKDAGVSRPGEGIIPDIVGKFISPDTGQQGDALPRSCRVLASIFSALSG